MSCASCPSLQHTPYTCNTQCWLRLRYMPWRLSPGPLRRAATLEKMPNITGRETHGPRTPCPCPLHYPRIWAHRLRPPFNTWHPHFLPQHPHSGSLQSPHIWHKRLLLSDPALWFPGLKLAGTAAAPTAGARAGRGGRGNHRCGGSLHPQRYPQLGAAVAWGREEGRLSLQAGVPGRLTDLPTSLCPHTAPPCLDGSPCVNGGRCTQLPSREAACL